MPRARISDTGAGYLIGKAATEAVGFHGAAPTPQRSGSAQAAVATTTPTTGAYGFTLAQAEAIIALLNELRAANVAKGLIKGSA